MSGLTPTQLTLRYLRDQGWPLVEVTEKWSHRLAIQGSDVETPCIVWLGCRLPKGYGKVSVGGGRSQLAHRVAYAAAYGPIPPHQVVRHQCDSPPCVNPYHLQLGTIADNNRDMRERERQARGVSHGLSKLTPSSVLEIRARRANGETYASLGRSFGVSEATCRDACSGRRWGWL